MNETISTDDLFHMLVYIEDGNNSAELGQFLTRFHLGVDAPVFRLGYVSYTDDSRGVFAHMTNQGLSWLMSEKSRRHEAALAAFQRLSDRAFEDRLRKLDRRTVWLSCAVSAAVAVLVVLLDHFLIR